LTSGVESFVISILDSVSGSNTLFTIIGFVSMVDETPTLSSLAPIYNNVWVSNGSTATGGCAATPYGYIQINTVAVGLSGISVKLTAEKIQETNPATTPPTYCS
jgi:hypothetical protein